MQDMVYQGTVLGPGFWNTYFNDSSRALAAARFKALCFADDLQGLKCLENHASSAEVRELLGCCQDELHKWGEANQVTFDSSKEHFHVLSRNSPEGDAFMLLGILFDCKLLMIDAIRLVAKLSNMKVKSILQCYKYFTKRQLVELYKSLVMSFVESKTCGIAHACSSHLDKIDSIQSKFLNGIDISDHEAFLHYNLAPLSCRRDLAMLAVIHKVVLGKGVPHLNDFVKMDTDVAPRGCRQYRRVCEHVGNLPDYLRRSLIGYLWIYNRLEVHVVAHNCVHAFQSAAQSCLRAALIEGMPNWQQLFSPRHSYAHHPILARHRRVV